LQLSGRGDIKRFFDRYEAVKQRFNLLKHDQQKMNEIFQETRPLSMTLQAGLFHNGSLLYRSLHNTLTDEQLARYDAVTGERRTFRHRATVELAVMTLEQSIPLTDAQRRKLIAIMANETKPARKSGQYDLQLIMLQVGRLPEEKLKPLFDNTQWKAVNQ